MEPIEPILWVPVAILIGLFIVGAYLLVVRLLWKEANEDDHEP